MTCRIAKYKYILKKKKIRILWKKGARGGGWREARFYGEWLCVQRERERSGERESTNRMVLMMQ